MKIDDGFVEVGLGREFCRRQILGALVAQDGEFERGLRAGEFRFRLFQVLFVSGRIDAGDDLPVGDA